MTNMVSEISTFKMVRPGLRIGGFATPVDNHVANLISNLQDKLSKKCLDENFQIADGKDNNDNVLTLDLDNLIKELESASPGPESYNFTSLIDKKGNTDLLYQVSQIIDANKLSYNTDKLLSQKPILGYLFCIAAYNLKLNTASAIYNYITNDTDGGIKLFYDYITIKSALSIKEDYKLETGNNADFIKKISPKLKSTNFSFAENTFTPAVYSRIKEQVFDKEEYKIISGVKDKLNISDEDIPALKNYIKQSKVKIDEDNAEFFLSIALNDIKNSSISYTSDASTAITDNDFSVTYYEDEKGTLEIVRENIACAAQLYYVMTLGEELEIFNVIDRIITKYLPSGQIDIRSKETLKYLQLYAFNERFSDDNGVEYKRTNPEERRMFYRQVFNAGGGETMEGMVVNGDFNTLWERLLVESVKYIEKMEKSENPTQFVSRQNICQAVEDLQYNLSTHSTGMTKVASPIINKELDFIIDRFLKNDELIKQLALSNSNSFWKVIERVLTDLRNDVPNVSALRSKGVYGHKIISAVANYNPGYFDDNKNFSEFISMVEAFIIANSQLEDGKNTGIPDTENSDSEEQPSRTGAVQGDEWNF